MTTSVNDSPAVFCPVDRYQISDLADLIKKLTPELELADIQEVLKGSVNISKEKMSPEHRQKFTAENSISSFEAYTFVRKLLVTNALTGESSYGKIGKSLEQIFFGGALFVDASTYELIKIKILGYHDPDTASVINPQPEGCNAGASTVSVRTSGIDGMEVGAYNEKAADKTRGKNNIYTNRSAFEAFSSKGFDFDKMEQDWVNPEVYKTTTDIRVVSKNINMAQDGWINPKLVGNVDVIHAALSKGRWDTTKINFNDRSALNNIIALTSNYQGKIATLMLVDQLTWETDALAAGSHIMVDSQIRWTSSDTPAVLCGSRQSHDIYGRRIGLFRQEESARLERYLRGAPDAQSRLTTLMAKEGMALYEEYKNAVSPYLKTLSRSKIEGLKIAAQGIVAGTPSPTEMFGSDKTAQMADAFAEMTSDLNEYYRNDDQVFQIITGTVIDYMKYRNQAGDINEAAGKLSRKKGFAFWSETKPASFNTFKILWDAYLNNPRYHPKDCQG